MKQLLIVLSFVGFLGACATNHNIPVSDRTIGAGDPVQFGDRKLALLNSGTLKLGNRFPDFAAKGEGGAPVNFKSTGSIKIVSVVPSIDTPVCEEQTHILSESEGIDPRVERYTISMDLPFAQGRFKREAKLTNIIYLSDFADKNFGRSTGLLVPENGLLARAVIVVDAQGVIRHLQVVPSAGMMPDMGKAITVANKIVGP